MFDILRLRGFDGLSPRRIDPVGIILRLDATYRERRRLEELTSEQLRDVGLTRADIDRILDRD